MRSLAVVYALLLVIPAVGASYATLGALLVGMMAGLLFPLFAAVGLLLAAMIVFQLKACLRLWKGDYRPILPAEKNAFGGGALVCTIILSVILSLGIQDRNYWFLAGSICLLLTSALLPITLTVAHKRFSPVANEATELGQQLDS